MVSKRANSLIVKALDPRVYVRRLRFELAKRRLKRRPNERGLDFASPGHFYSPLLDIAALPDAAGSLEFDGEELWEHVDLRIEHQRFFYEDLARTVNLEQFPAQPHPRYRYYSANDYFPIADAITLSHVVRSGTPGRIVEVGSGFSSAVILDSLDAVASEARCTFIEPYPARLQSVLREGDSDRCEIVTQPVQSCDLDLFGRLKTSDILFIDSSHVAKVGSDVTWLLLRVLPRLNPGVLVHFHDIVYPHAYPIDWIRRGCAWNESLFLRAFLMGNDRFEVVAFNSFAAQKFADLFERWCPAFVKSGGSFWLRTQGR